MQRLPELQGWMVQTVTGIFIQARSTWVEELSKRGYHIPGTIHFRSGCIDATVRFCTRKGFKCPWCTRLSGCCCLISGAVKDMARRLTAIADGVRDNADMTVSMPKTFSQHVHKRAKLTVTETEAKAAERKYKFKCDFCPRRFKTKRSIQIHGCSCIYNYGTTQEVFEVEKVVGAFGHGHVDNRWLAIRTLSEVESTSQSRVGDNIYCNARDGCHEVVWEFWSHPGLNPCARYIHDKDDKRRWAVCCKVYKRAQGLKAHKTRMRHHHCKVHKVMQTVVADAIVRKRIEEQTDMSKVKWGEEETKTSGGQSTSARCLRQAESVWQMWRSE